MICALVGTALIVTDVVNKDYKRPQIFIDWGKDMDESVNGILTELWLEMLTVVKMKTMMIVA